ncbi:MAG: dethiobiotin synthase [Acetobacteraceae bacterium]
MSAVFITGTGTDIGKTFIAAGLIRALRRAGRPVQALKPVLSGYDPAAAASSDPGLLLAALGRPVTPETVAAIAPWRFQAPLSPDMAARREGRMVDFDAVLGFCRQVMTQEGVLLIEGVGGIMVPLDERRTVLDWMQALGLPVILVCGSYLGSISHTLTAVDVLVRRRLSLTALVVNETAGSTVDLQETAETLARFAGPQRILALPLREPDHPVFATLAALV